MVEHFVLLFCLLFYCDLIGGISVAYAWCISKLQLYLMTGNSEKVVRGSDRLRVSRILRKKFGPRSFEIMARQKQLYIRSFV